MISPPPPCSSAGWEDDIDRAGEVAGFGEVARRPEQHRRVTVVTAGMHDTRMGRSIGKAGLLDDGQRVDIGPEADRGYGGLPTPDDADDARAGDTCHDFVDSEIAKLALNDLARAGFLEREFGVPMQVTAPCRHVVLVVGDAVVDRHWRLSGS